MSEWSAKAARGRTIWSWSALAVMAAAPVLGCFVDTSPRADTLHWRTALADHRTVTWSWPETARSAKLSVQGLLGSETKVFGPGTDEWPLSGFAKAAKPEDVLSLRLDFFTSEDATGNALAGETLAVDGIGLVDPTNSCVRVVEFNSELWCRSYAPAAVFAVAADTLSVTRNGQDALPFSAPGWCGSRISGWGPATALTSLSPAGAVSTLVNYRAATLFLFR